MDGNGNVYIAQSSGVLKETLSPDGSGYSETVIARIQGVERVGIAVDGVGQRLSRHKRRGLQGDAFRRQLSQSTIASNVKQPDWIAVDGRGNVYIADNADNRVLKETPSGDHYAQSVVFSPSTSGANSLNGLAVDAIGKVYFLSDGNVWKSTPAAGGYQTYRVLAGTYGRGLAVDGAGNLYVTVGSTQVLQETLSRGKVHPKHGGDRPLACRCRPRRGLQREPLRRRPLRQPGVEGVRDQLPSSAKLRQDRPRCKHALCSQREPDIPIDARLGG